ncbi:protein-L-isoaspartate O-methyltransferase family protein [Lentibacter sp. XHP0401]|uniref:protein-L-isoaspartate O-methyltransferase family protein n=1 Tax=Lentibacter sp. XHP0401 TaxID=2984334 RepID=UPI0021E903FF|nr:protein-L-isoaspartate O-methyltransferase [Lentibacter sp. XHP0401]MCV2892821.1 protein-L-isoaspartate O-methyltransferase [Lentibacter sp. XHP0401]
MTDFIARRRMMVDNQVRPSDVTKFPIIEAMLSVERENFVPQSLREAAYLGENLTLAQGRVLLEPRTLAKMLDALDITGNELVLDLGCGMGYSSAVIARMAEAVIAVEEDEALAREAETLLAEAGAVNAVVEQGPIAAGAPQHGPYDVITIEGAVETVPQAILDQLKEGGRMVAIFAEGKLGTVRIGHKINGQMSWRFSFNAGAPVLAGFEKAEAFCL